MTDNRNPAKGEKSKRTEKESKPSLNLNAATFVPSFKKNSDAASAQPEEVKQIASTVSTDKAPVSEISAASDIKLNVNAPAFKPKKAAAPLISTAFNPDVRALI